MDIEKNNGEEIKNSFREGTIADIDQIMEIQKAAIKDAYVGSRYGITEEMVEADYNDDKKQKFLGFFKTTKYFVAEDNNKLVGVVSASNDSKIRTMWILPEFQSKGVGSKLLTMALEYLQDKPEIYLTTGNQQEGRAIKFYEKFAFKRTGKETELYLYPGQKHPIEDIEFIRTKN